MERRLRATAVAALLILLAGCDTDDGRTLDPPTQPLPAPAAADTTAPTAPVELALVAPWQDGAPIPVRHTCDELGIAPPLSWTNVPAGTVELAITLTDLDAPGDIGWILSGLPPDRSGLAEGEIPADALVWVNSAGEADYAGPCPPPGETHRYQFTLHALNQQLEVADDASATEVVSMLNLTAIDQSSVSGTHARGG